MNLICCPFCGPRDESEFRYGGQANVTRPEPSENVSEAEWMRYLFIYSNHAGLNLERWVHAWGCHTWFNMVRNARTHEIEAVYSIDEPPPPEFGYLLHSLDISQEEATGEAK